MPEQIPRNAIDTQFARLDTSTGAHALVKIAISGGGGRTYWMPLPPEALDEIRAVFHKYQ
jgi:hypothetical protein